MCPHIMTMHKAPARQGATADTAKHDPQGKQPPRAVSSEYLDGALVTAGAAAAESSPHTAPGAAAPLSRPALATAPRDEDGPLVSEADPTSNAG